MEHCQKFCGQDCLHCEAVSLDQVLNGGDETAPDKGVANDGVERVIDENSVSCYYGRCSL